MRRIVLGTRGSDLARAQTSSVEKALRAAYPEIEVAIEIITTRGDVKDYPSGHGRKGLFTGEIERALVSRQIDAAVHSAKDLPSDATAGLEICAVLPRASVEDVLVAKSASDLPSVAAGATIATGSVRRQHQLRWLRPDLKIAELRGNVPTRLRKLSTNPWDAIVLARAGLERLGFDPANGEIEGEGVKLRTAILSTDQFIPAGGQGAVALQIRSDDEVTRRALEELNDNETLLCLRAEREFLRLLQGDCGTPVGVLAKIQDGSMTMRAQIFDEGRAEPRAATLQKRADEGAPESLAAELLELINGR